MHGGYRDGRNKHDSWGNLLIQRGERCIALSLSHSVETQQHCYDDYHEHGYTPVSHIRVSCESSRGWSVTLLAGVPAPDACPATGRGHGHKTASPLAGLVSGAGSQASATWLPHPRVRVAGRHGRDSPWCSTHQP